MMPSGIIQSLHLTKSRELELLLFYDVKQACVLSLEVVMGGYAFLQTHGLYIFYSSPMTSQLLQNN